VTGSALPPGRYRLDPIHSFAAFSVRHMLVGRVDGRFNTIAGVFVVTDDPERRFDLVDVSVDPASIDTQVDARDEDLRSPRFFDVASFPRLTFRGRDAGQTDANSRGVAGDLTIRDISLPVSFAVIVRGATTDPHGHTRMGGTATAALRRREFGLTTELEQESGDGPDPDIHVRLDIEAVLEDAEGST
jgi:polyisoprenoid-binding protein YceI